MPLPIKKQLLAGFAGLLHRYESFGAFWREPLICIQPHAASQLYEEFLNSFVIFQAFAEIPKKNMP